MTESKVEVDLVEIPEDDGFEVAIIGGGIVGLALAIGLLQRNINFKIYERYHDFHEVGAGIAFTLNAERALKALHPSLHTAYRNVAAQNDEDNFYYLDGYNHSKEKPGHEDTMLKLYLGERGFEGCRRPDLMNEMVKLIPGDYVELGKDLVSATESDGNGRIQMVFRDGSTATADVGKFDKSC